MVAIHRDNHNAISDDQD